MAPDVVERPAGSVDEAEPGMVLFSDEDGADFIDDVELITLTSDTLGAIVARRC